MNLFTRDAQQQGLSFLVSQATYIEAQAYEIRYPDITYPNLVPLDSSAPEWSKSITFYSTDKVGEARLINHRSQDIPNADVVREKFTEDVHLAAIGYEYTMEEIAQAMQLNLPLTADRAMAAVRAYEEFMETSAFNGIPGIAASTGLINNASVTATTADTTGTGSSTLWADKTGPNMIKDVNDALTGIHSGTLTVEMADTVLLPVDQFHLLATTQHSSGTDTTALEYLLRNNVYTATTGNPLTVRMMRQLDGAGTSISPDGDRMIVYRRDPTVIKMHVPMAHRFLPAQGPYGLTFKVPGIFRTAGLEIRRPSAVRYVDGI